ncbi:hypothetical protein [Brevibacillus sp. SYSU BS000544]|uniref:hypothetical protein n=1 Tax=Brevibacillus sp. SYSU BS000544 TaxID=3416443 RepID=UPI003CE51B5B
MKKILFSVLVLTFILPGVSFAAEDPVDDTQTMLEERNRPLEPRLPVVKPT